MVKEGNTKELVKKAYYTARIKRRNVSPVKTLKKLQIDIVSGCQLRCIGCPNSVLPKNIKPVTPEDFNKILSNIDVDHIELLRLYSFGEPFLHSNIAEVLKQIPKQKFSVGTVEISTNGQVFGEKMLTEAIKLKIINTIVVSCDGDGTPSEYERLRPPAKWDKLIKFLKGTKKIKDKYDPKMLLVTRSVCETVEGRKRWIKLSKDLGLGKPMLRNWIVLPESSNEPWKRKAKVPKRVCSWLAHDHLVVDQDGTVRACCFHPKVATFGNLNKQKFNQINKSKSRNAFVKALNKKRSKVRYCNECEA